MAHSLPRPQEPLVHTANGLAKVCILNLMTRSSVGLSGANQPNQSIAIAKASNSLLTKEALCASWNLLQEDFFGLAKEIQGYFRARPVRPYFRTYLQTRRARRAHLDS